MARYATAHTHTWQAYIRLKRDNDKTRHAMMCALSFIYPWLQNRIGYFFVLKVARNLPLKKDREDDIHVMVRGYAGIHARLNGRNRDGQSESRCRASNKKCFVGSTAPLRSLEHRQVPSDERRKTMSPVQSRHLVRGSVLARHHLPNRCPQGSPAL